MTPHRPDADPHDDAAPRAVPWLNSASFWYPELVMPSAWLQHAPFAYWLMSALEPRVLVELGTHRGFSYFAFCQAVKRLGLGTRCYAVDTWKGDEHAGFYGEEVFKAVQAHNEAHYSAFSRLVRSTFDEALAHFPDGSVDLLHIDGRHYYDDVKHDFESWRPKLSDRAVVLLHDTNVRERDFGVHRLWAEVAGAHPSFEFLHGHGLGVLAHGPLRAPMVADFLAAMRDARNATQVRNAYARLGSAVSAAHEVSRAKEELAAKLAARDKQAAEKIAHEAERARETERQLADARRTLSELMEKAAAKEREIAGLKAAAAQRDREIADLKRGLAEAKRNLRRAQALQAHAEEWSRAYSESTSWKITRPIRVVKRLAVEKPFRNEAIQRGRALLAKLLRSGPAPERSAPPQALKVSSPGLLDLHSSTYTSRRPYPLPEAAQLDRIAAEYLTNRVRTGETRADVAIFTAVTNGYDTHKLHEHLNPAFDYYVFSDGDARLPPAYHHRRIDYFDEDPVRSARFVKLHPHFYLPEYRIAVWVDGNIVIRDDISDLVSDFVESGLPLGGIPHPLRASVYEEADECIRREKDVDNAIQSQMSRYSAEGFDCSDLIESNLLMFRLDHPALAPALSAWWAEIERGSRRDQLSFNYAMRKVGTNWHPLTSRPNSIRNHPKFALLQHTPATKPTAIQEPSSQVMYSKVVQDRIARVANRDVDVIVCVHNALDVTQECLRSVIAARRSAPHRIVLVDDGSDTRTREFLSDFARREDNVALIRHEEARGYTRAANAGLRAATGDLVILLNSDTVVSPNWVEKLADAAFHTRSVGIVGPLSNAASHQSIPDHRSTKTQTAINALPPHMKPADIDRWCEDNTPADFLPRTSLVHGFCFGVTREAIESVGYFDESHFPFGYGEENDYCIRVINAGLSLVIATHTYVYHEKSQSYTDDERRLSLMRSGNRKIRDIHGATRVDRAVRSMQSNPHLAKLRSLASALYESTLYEKAAVPSSNPRKFPTGAASMKNLDKSIEFFVPSEGLDVEPYIQLKQKQGIHHVGRYVWASPVVAGSARVLDVACGAGYGPYIYAKAHASSQIVGVDYDSRAIGHAKAHYQSDNLTFRAGDMVTWRDDLGEPLGEFDTISSFDTIEHLLHREIALMQVARNLSPGGQFLLSTPCGHSATILNPAWEHHKIEYSFNDLYPLLSAFFEIVLYPDNGTLPNVEFFRNVINHGEVRYLNRFNPVVCRKPTIKRWV